MAGAISGAALCLGARGPAGGMLREAGGGAAPDALAAAFSWEAEPGADPGPLLCGRGGGEPPDCSGSSQDFLRQLMNVGGEAPGEGLSQSGAPGPASTAEDRRALQKARQLQEKNKRAQQRWAPVRLCKGAWACGPVQAGRGGDWRKVVCKRRRHWEQVPVQAEREAGGVSEAGGGAELPGELAAERKS